MYLDKLKVYIVKLVKPPSPNMLGRWRVTSCEEIKTVYNNIYQNRDHCGDIICKTPNKAEKYIDKK